MTSVPKWQLVETENGAISFNTTGSARIDLFFKTVRKISAENLVSLLESSWVEDPCDTVKILFNARDCRGGKGERDLFLLGFQWLVRKDVEAAKRLVGLIPDYGRWDDLIKLVVVPELEDTVFQVIQEQVALDLAGMAEEKPISLLAKWLPTERGKVDKETGFVRKYCGETMQKSDYRKQILTPLRNYLNIVEINMASGQWEKIEFQKVPSLAMKKYRKAFAIRQPERFAEYLQSVQKGEVEIKAKQLFPHEVVDVYFKDVIRNQKPEIDVVLEEQWKVLQAETEKLGSFDKAIWLADMSGSMSGVPMLVAATLSLLCSGFSQAPYTNKVMTFADNPVFCTIEGETLRDRVWDMYTKMSPSGMWGGSTNLQAVFDLILTTAKESNLDPDLLPTSIYIISDMQFNQAFGNVSNDEAIRSKYAESGYQVPKIIYWNVRANTLDFPVSNLNAIDTALISGFSPAVLKAVLNSTSFTPLSIVLDTINDERYQPVHSAFTGEDPASED